ncbi:hypothetical protein ABK040_003624 [Willaertia magna]
MKETMITNICHFEFNKEKNCFLSNKDVVTNFTEIENVKNCCCESSSLFYITNSGSAYKVKAYYNKTENNNSSVLLNEKNVIDINVHFGRTNILTREKAYVKVTNSGVSEIDLPEIDTTNDRFIRLASGDRKFVFLLTENGKVFICGENNNGVFGCKIENDNQLTKFVKHKELEEKIKSKIIDIQCGHLFAIIRCKNGDCYATGYNYYLNTGINSNFEDITEFTLIKELKGKVKQHSCGFFHSAFLTFDGEVYVTGKFDE